jgi:RimJ/RimL family protein N-acetyltransferase
MNGLVEARIVGARERSAALEYLECQARDNLYLLDLTARLGQAPAPGEMSTEIAGAWRNGELVGLAGLRPSVVLDAEVREEAIEAFVPLLDSLAVGLVKSPVGAVDLLWKRLSRRRRRQVLVDRIETAYALKAQAGRLQEPRPGEMVRPASVDDLEPLVIAARESLREEQRPDPFAGDARAFRRWVKGRVGRARVVEVDGDVRFAGYADVRRPEGWLLQGIYTWPEMRRRGYARAGVSELCREAFAAGADHVQLAVVEGNEAGRRLYESLGFEPFGQLRTILFT